MPNPRLCQSRNEYVTAVGTLDEGAEELESALADEAKALDEEAEVQGRKKAASQTAAEPRPKPWTNGFFGGDDRTDEASPPHRSTDGSGFFGFGASSRDSSGSRPGSFEELAAKDGAKPTVARGLRIE